MDFALSPLYVELQEEARAVARAVEPVAVEADGMSTLHPGVAHALRSSRLCELLVPEAYGGRFERLDTTAIASGSRRSNRSRSRSCARS